MLGDLFQAIMSELDNRTAGLGEHLCEWGGSRTLDQDNKALRRDAATRSCGLGCFCALAVGLWRGLPLKAFDAPATYDWTGYYTGAHLDYQAGHSRWPESRFGALGAAGVFDVGKGYDFSSGTGSYAIGFQGRYDYMAASHHVFGVEGDIWFPNTVSGKQTFTTAVAGSGTYSETVPFSGTLRGCSISLVDLPE